MRVPAKAVALGLTLALAGVGASILPPVVGFEADLGLGWLFRLRGPRPAPDGVIVVAIDRESSDHLRQSNDPVKWPRTLHARLVRNLTKQGAGVIVFDVIFDEPRNSSHDRSFAEAVRDAGNVVLIEYLERESHPVTGSGGASKVRIEIETHVPPIPELASAAAALAPFPLPKVPVKLSQYWLFKTAAGDAPTLPVAAFQVYSRPLHDDLLRVLPPRESERLSGVGDARAENQDLGDLWGRLRRTLRADPTLVQTLLTRLRDDSLIADSHDRRVLSALIEMLSGGDTRYLDFYGPAGSIPTIPYYRVLENDFDRAGETARVDFRGSAVFVGFAEQLRPEKKDGFYTVFSKPDGTDVSGVEIAATAFANLLERRAVTPLSKPLHFLVIALWGMALGALFLSLPAAGILLTAGAFAAAYMVGACYAFAHSSSWIPVVVPLLVQMPAAVVSGLLWQYLDTRRERQKIRETFSHYLPRSVVDDLTDGSGHIETTGHRVYAVCLHSDAGGYTPLSETLNADELFALLNRFFQPILEQVTRRGGSVSDIIGDGMLAIWPALPPGAKPRELRQQACHAALDIIDAVDEFNRGTGEARLPARVGLHCGEVRMGSVGAADHFEYRAVGDTVNTAERIQRLNKEMKTRVIASREAVEGLEAIVTRELGSFRLEGKANPLAMHELVCRAGQLDAARSSQYADFAAALEAFRTQRWHSGANAFRNVIDQYGEDGPARYYLGRCEQYLRRPPPAPWDGVVTLGPKQERLGAT